MVEQINTASRRSHGHAIDATSSITPKVVPLTCIGCDWKQQGKKGRQLKRKERRDEQRDVDRCCGDGTTLILL